MQAYASSYSGHARVNRLLFIASKTVGTPTELEALRLAADQLRKVCAWLLPDHSQQSLRGHRAVDTVVDVSVCVLCCKRYPRWVATLLMNLLQGCVLLHTWWTVCQGTVRARLQGENTVQYVDVMDRIGSRLGAAYTLDR